jgi:uncharacterized iron-regulated membrane protein
MRPLLLAFFRAGQAIASVLLLGLATGCSYESLHAANGSGYRLGLAVVPTAALLTLALSLVGLLGYRRWRRRRKG